MTQLAEIQAHIGSMHELLDVVSAMRALAGMRVQEAQQALPGIRRYAESMAAAVGSVLRLMPPSWPRRGAPAARRALILCTAEHGFVGGFNERLLDAAVTVLGPHDELYVLGSRGAALAFERGRGVGWTRPMATRLAGVPESIGPLTARLYEGIAHGQIARVEIMFACYRQGNASLIERRTLLPLDTAALTAVSAAEAPLHNLAPQALLEGLAAEYLFALLTEAAAQSIGSENAARFAAMESAHDNVSHKLADLQQAAHQVRQDEITAELLDLIVGAEALAKHPTGPRANGPDRRSAAS